MKERPKCEYPECTNGALLLAYGKMLCGDCFMKIKKKQEENLWKVITDGNA
jgi:hypothetical protein